MIAKCSRRAEIVKQFSLEVELGRGFRLENFHRKKDFAGRTKLNGWKPVQERVTLIIVEKSP
jgi:hypothetical protein